MNKAILIPVYNEVESVEKVVSEVLQNRPDDTLLILVNDGSNDGTESILQKLMSGTFCRDNHIHILNRSQNLGYGASLVEGFEYCLQSPGCLSILTMDCDEQHQPADIRRFFSVDESLLVVSASRYLDSEERGISAPEDRQKINQKITRTLVKIARAELGEEWLLTDAFCGMKRYARPFLENFLRFYRGLNEDAKDGGYAFPLIVWRFFLFWLKREDLRIHDSFIELAIPRIYITDSRSFGEALDFPLARYKYYLKTLYAGIK